MGCCTLVHVTASAAPFLGCCQVRYRVQEKRDGKSGVRCRKLELFKAFLNENDVCMRIALCDGDPVPLNVLKAVWLN